MVSHTSLAKQKSPAKYLPVEERADTSNADDVHKMINKHEKA